MANGVPRRSRREYQKGIRSDGLCVQTMDDNDLSEGFGLSPDPATDLALFAAISEEEGWDRQPVSGGCCGCLGAIVVLLAFVLAAAVC